MKDYIYIEEDEEEKKKKRRKLILWLIFLIIFIIVSIITVVLVIAANQQVLNTDININYRANNVSAEISARYWTDNEKINMYSGDSLIIAFDARESEIEKSISPRENIELDANHGIVFEYEFKNLSDYEIFNIGLARTPKDYGIELTYNIVEKFYYSTSQISIEQFNNLNDEDFDDSYEMQTIGLGTGTRLFVYVKVTVDKLENNAAYKGAFNWVLVDASE